MTPIKVSLSRLDKIQSNVVKVMGRTKDRIWFNSIDIEKAYQYVIEEAAFVNRDGVVFFIYDKMSLKKFVLKRDNNICKYCGEIGTTVDHIIPRAQGGLSTPKNLTCACQNCNVLKGSLEVETFKFLLLEWEKFPEFKFGTMIKIYQQHLQVI
jgi:hypothetical protein